MKKIKNYKRFLKESKSEDKQDVYDILYDFFLSESEEDFEITDSFLSIDTGTIKMCPYCGSGEIGCDYSYNSGFKYCECFDCNHNDNETEFFVPLFERDSPRLITNSFSITDKEATSSWEIWNKLLSKLTSSQKERLSSLINPYGYFIYLIQNPDYYYTTLRQHKFEDIWVITDEETIEKLNQELEDSHPATLNPTEKSSRNYQITKI